MDLVHSLQALYKLVPLMHTFCFEKWSQSTTAQCNKIMSNISVHSMAVKCLHFQESQSKTRRNVISEIVND